MLQYAGIGLPLSTPSHQQWLAEIHPQLDFRDWSGWNFAGWDTAALPTPDLPVQPPPVCGVLSWPTGACRPAFFHCVVNTSKLALIRTAVGDPMTAKPLAMSDGRTGKTITTDLFMLPPRPLNQLGHAASDAWLLSLTDARFFWPWRRGNVSATPVSWASLVSSLAGFLGVTIAQDAVPSAYAAPTAKWKGYLRNTPTVLDAALEQIGQRLACGLDGTYRAVNWETARGESDAYFAAADPEISGGRLDYADIARYTPSSVRVSMGSGNNLDIPYSVVVPLTGTVASGEYAPSTGFAGPIADFFGDLVFTGLNAAAATGLAVQAASDWYGWRLTDADVVFPGIEPWVPTGWEDVIEWTYQERDGEDGPTPFASTMIRRGPFNDLVSGNWKSGLKTPSGSACGIGWGWMMGLQPGTLCPSRRGSCLRMTFESTAGHCLNLDTTQVIDFEWDVASKTWIGTTSLIIADDKGAGVSIDVGGPVPMFIISVSGSAGTVDYIMAATCGNETDRWVEFVGPNPKSGESICNDTWADPCDDNTFKVRVTCIPCPNPDWTGSGWYCVSDLADCDDPAAVKTCNFYDTDPGTCIGPGGTAGYICGGPFETEAECRAICNPDSYDWYCVTVGDVTGCVSVPVGDPPPAGSVSGPYAEATLCYAACAVNAPCSDAPVFARCYAAPWGDCSCYAGTEWGITACGGSFSGYDQCWAMLLGSPCEANYEVGVKCNTFSGQLEVTAGPGNTANIISYDADAGTLIVYMAGASGCAGGSGGFFLTFTTT